ncbi:MAG: HAD family hydrolase [Oscillospiraceae bacterium]|nr:HAD family hydrolase [Oscillospiraceae bacterium]
MNKAIFWDFDGTLVYSRHLWSGSLLKTLERYTENNTVTLDNIRPPMARGFTWDEPDKTVGLKDEAWWDYTNRHIADVYRAVGISESEITRLLPLYRLMIMEKENYLLYPDTFSVLSALKERGYKNYLLSNNYPELEEVAEALGLTDFLDGMIVSARVGYDKPRREIFDIALKAAGCPEKAYMAGDNPFSDIKGANSCGIPAILVHNDNNYGFDCIKCRELTEILDICK